MGNVSTFTTTKPLVENMSPAPSSSISSPVPWIPFDRVHSDKFSDQTTLFSDKAEPVTTGPKVTTQKEQNSLTQFSISSAKKQKVVIACKVSNYHIPLVVELDPEWERLSSAKSVKNTLTES